MEQYNLEINGMFICGAPTVGDAMNYALNSENYWADEVLVIDNENMVRARKNGHSLIWSIGEMER